MNYTVTQIMKWRPCYDIERVEALIGDGKTASEIAALDIPNRDRVWCLIRMLIDVRGKTVASDFVGNCALRAHYHAKDTAAAYYAAASAAIAAAYAEHAVAVAAAKAVNAAAYADLASVATHVATTVAIAAYAAYAADGFTAATDAAICAVADAAIAAVAANDDSYVAAKTDKYDKERQWQIDRLVEEIGG